MNLLTEEGVKGLMTKYRELYLALQPQMDELDRLKAMIVNYVKDEGLTSLAHDGVEATYRKGYTRASWDGKGLAGYAVAHPEIMAFRSESSVGPSVSVKVKM